MNRYALIKGGVVITIIEQAAQPGVEGVWVDCTGLHVGPGFTYNGSVFAAPLAAAKWSLTQRAFWRRFLVAEREALQGLLATGTQNQKNKLNAFRDYVLTGMNVELSDDYIIASVTLMETAGVIGGGRASIILNTSAAPSEQ